MKRARLKSADTPKPAGHRKNGQFAKGNKFASNRKGIKNAARFRELLFEVVTEEDIIEIVKKLIAGAKRGEKFATRELLDRLLGKAPVNFEAVIEVGEFDPDERFL